MPRQFALSARAIAWLMAWLIALCVLAFGVQRNLVLSSDLRSFMPPAQTADQKLLIEQIGEGPASRLLLLAIAHAPAEQLAAASRGLASALHGDAHFVRILNGEADLSTLDPALLPYRYLLSPTLDNATFDASYLRNELQQRVEDLGSPAAALLKPLLPRDPTLETLKLAQRWTPLHTPQLRDGVWFSPRWLEALAACGNGGAGLRSRRAGRCDRGFASGVRCAAGARRGASEYQRPRLFQRGRQCQHAPRGGMAGWPGLVRVCAAAAGRLSQRRRTRIRCAAAREWRVDRHRRDDAGLRADSRHHARIRFHPARRRPGIPDPLPESPARGRERAGKSARRVAALAPRHRLRVHRLSGVFRLGRRRPAATRGVHDCRFAHRGFRHALSAAAGAADAVPRCCAVRVARTIAPQTRRVAAPALAAVEPAGARRCRALACADAVLAKRSRRSDAGAAGLAQARRRIARRTRCARRALSARDRGAERGWRAGPVGKDFCTSGKMDFSQARGRRRTAEPLSAEYRHANRTSGETARSRHAAGRAR